MRPYFHTCVRFFVFYARSAARPSRDGTQLPYALRRWEPRRQTQTTIGGVQTATSWLKYCTTCCVAHSCLYRTRGSVIEDKTGTVSYCLLCVMDATRTVLRCLLLCCIAAIKNGSNRKSALPMLQATEKATVRTHLCLFSAFTYGMWGAQCSCYLFAAVL